MAILAGDGLLHHAMETMAAACYANPSQKSTGAMLAIARGAGINGMLTGQVVDVYMEGKPLDAQTLEFIHLHKTAAMIRGALEAGATVGGADAETIQKFGLAGEKIGMAFQILDDILDVTGTEEELGDLLFSAVNVARHMGIDPEVALGKSCDKFISRFEYVESESKEEGKLLTEMTLSQMDELYEKAMAAFKRYSGQDEEDEDEY